MKKTVISIIFLIFAIQTAFSVSAYDGMNINNDAYTQKNDAFFDSIKEFSILFDYDYGDDFLPDTKITADFANEAFSAFFGENPLFKSGEITNEEIFVLICRLLKIEKKEKPFSAIKNFNDFGFISSENKGYYESVFSDKKTSEKYLNPKKSADYKSLFSTLSIFEKEIFLKNGFEYFSDTVIENSVLGSARTIKTSGGREFKTGVGENVLTLGFEAVRGTKCDFIVKDNSLFCVKGTEKAKENGPVKVSGIYRANLFLFDKNTGKFILKNLRHYQNNSFVPINSSYSDFDSYGNFITVLNFQKCDRNLLNGSYIDREITFITALDGDTEKIVYVYLN